MERPTMGCGHTAQAVDATGAPVCSTCLGIVDGAATVAPPPDLAGRWMECVCRERRPSNGQGAFFEHRPGRPDDKFYCGHAGWD